MEQQPPIPEVSPGENDQGGNNRDKSDYVEIDHGESHGERLFQYTFDEGRQEARFLIFRGLQLMNIFNLQNELARLKHGIITTKTATPQQTASLTKVLHNYTKAIRDYEYLTRLTPITGSQARRGHLDLERVFGGESCLFTDEGLGYRRFADPSLLPTDNVRDLLKRHLPRSMTYTKYDVLNRTDEYFANEPAEQVSVFVDRLARFLVAFLGGAMLIVPMVIMRLPTVTVVKSLVTASISVLLFAGALSIFFKAGNTDTLVATATYAAVLVVFVGVSG